MERVLENKEIPKNKVNLVGRNSNINEIIRLRFNALVEIEED